MYDLTRTALDYLPEFDALPVGTQTRILNAISHAHTTGYNAGFAVAYSG